jgi:hypothetical protein
VVQCSGTPVVLVAATWDAQLGGQGVQFFGIVGQQV